MATSATKKAIDVLLLTVERSNIPYVELENDYRTDNGESAKKIKDTLDQIRASLDGGRKDAIEGITYVTTKAAPIVAVMYIEVEHATDLKDAQAWLDEIGLEWVKANIGWRKEKNSFRQGYTGYQLNSKS